MSTAISLLPLWAFAACFRVNFTFTFTYVITCCSVKDSKEIYKHTLWAKRVCVNANVCGIRSSNLCCNASDLSSPSSVDNIKKLASLPASQQAHSLSNYKEQAFDVFVS